MIDSFHSINAPRLQVSLITANLVPKTSAHTRLLNYLFSQPVNQEALMTWDYDVQSATQEEQRKMALSSSPSRYLPSSSNSRGSLTATTTTTTTSSSNSAPQAALTLRNKSIRHLRAQLRAERALPPPPRRRPRRENVAGGGNRGHGDEAVQEGGRLGVLRASTLAA